MNILLQLEFYSINKYNIIFFNIIIIIGYPRVQRYALLDQYAILVFTMLARVKMKVILYACTINFLSRSRVYDLRVYLQDTYRYTRKTPADARTSLSIYIYRYDAAGAAAVQCAYIIRYVCNVHIII